MGLILKYVKRTSSGGFEYRRRVPKDIVNQIAKREFKQVLGGTEREALRSYPNIHGHFERQIEEARASNSHNEAAQNGKLGRRELWEVASRRVRDMLDGANDPDEIRDILAESILDGYPKGPASDEHEGEPIGVPELDRLIIGLLRNPSAGPPKPTLLDAIERYRGDKYGDYVPGDHRSNQLRLDRITKHVREALDGFPVLEKLRREDARRVRDFLAGQRKDNGEMLSSASVQRELTIIKAIVNHGMREFDVRGDVRNPFNDLRIGGANATGGGQAEIEMRLPIPASVIKAMRERLAGNRLPELSLIWRLLEGTGCRLAEIVGLRAEDVMLDHDIPHLVIAPHEGRRLKSASSKRLVPLSSDALRAAVESLRVASGEACLFPRYMKPRGPDAASAALMVHLKVVRTDSRQTVHSLRHNMKDALRLAGVTKGDQDTLLGHKSKDAGDIYYGGEAARLEVSHRAIEKALKVHAGAELG